MMHLTARGVGNAHGRDYAPLLGQVYKVFVGGYLDSTRTLKRLTQDTRSAAAFESAVVASGAPLEFLMIQVVQRVPRYILLLRELLTHTPQDVLGEEHTQLSLLLERMSDICATIDGSIRAHD
jgi:hypothetical protein